MQVIWTNHAAARAKERKVSRKRIEREIIKKWHTLPSGEAMRVNVGSSKVVASLTSRFGEVAISVMKHGRRQ